MVSFTTICILAASAVTAFALPQQSAVPKEKYEYHVWKFPWFSGFEIQLFAYEDASCADGSEINSSKGKVVQEEHGCVVFDFDKPFSGFAFRWSKAWPDGDCPKWYGDCKIEFWDNENCEGDAPWHEDNVGV